jgi:hypothetical protein
VGAAATGDTSSLRLYLNRLRRKLEPDPGRPRHLLTEPVSATASSPDGYAAGAYEPGTQARVLTLSAFQALIVTISETSAPISSGEKCSATAP